MCTRILNSLHPELPVTARNMDWFWPVNTALFTFPEGEQRSGLPLKNKPQQITGRHNTFCWESKYASIATVMGDKHTDYSTIDGMSEPAII